MGKIPVSVNRFLELCTSFSHGYGWSKTKTNPSSWRWIANQAKRLPAWCLVCYLVKLEAYPWLSLLLVCCTWVSLECDSFHLIFVASTPHQMHFWSSIYGRANSQGPEMWGRSTSVSIKEKNIAMKTCQLTYPYVYLLTYKISSQQIPHLNQEKEEGL